MTWLVVLGTLAAGSVGAVLRFVIQESLASRPASWIAVLIVNIAGSAFAGGFLALPATSWTGVLVVGFAGGLTTFSTLALQLVRTPTGPKTSVLLGRALVHIVGAVAAALGAFHVVLFLT